MTDDINSGDETPTLLSKNTQLKRRWRRVRIERGILRGLDVIKLITYAIIIAMLMAVAAPVLFLIVRGAR